MKLDTEFYRLPLRFDVDRLIEEIQGFDEQEWRPHPQGFPGNSALVLISVRGEQNDDMQGPMRPTDKLARMPYARQVLAAFDTIIGRSRLMRLGPQSDVAEHTDIHFYWHDRVRIHVPIITDPSIRFWCNGVEVHMAPGEAWIFNNWWQHKVINPTDIARIHLVADTTGSSAFWDLLSRADRPADPRAGPGEEPHFVPYRPDVDAVVPTERVNLPTVMPPGEVDLLLREFASELRAPPDLPASSIESLLAALAAFGQDWRSLWSQHGAEPAGWPRYEALRDDLRSKTAELSAGLWLPALGVSAREFLSSRLSPMLNPRMAATGAGSSPAAATRPRGAARRLSPPAPRFHRPIFIVSAPRSGSTLLFETLSRNRALWTIGDESHVLIESIPGLNPGAQDFHSNRLTGADLDAPRAAALLSAFIERLQDADRRRLVDLPGAERPPAVRFLEKTPKNALRIPFFQALFPDALFVFLWRSPRDNLSSIMDAWRSGRFVTYPELPGWRGPPWSLLLTPGWRGLNGAPLEEIAAHQWRAANLQILDDLTELAPERWIALRYEDLLSDPKTTLERLCAFVGVPFGSRMLEVASGQLPLSRYTLTPPDPDKWRRNENELKRVLPKVSDVVKELEAAQSRAASPAESEA